MESLLTSSKKSKKKSSRNRVSVGSSIICQMPDSLPHPAPRHPATSQADSAGTRAPRDLRVPAEWEPIQCVWLAWPHARDTWPGIFSTIPDFYARWVEMIAESTLVRILAGNEVARDCERTLGKIANTEIVSVATNDAWVRDYGPTFVADQRAGSIHAPIGITMPGAESIRRGTMTTPPPNRLRLTSRCPSFPADCASKAARWSSMAVDAC